MARTSPAAASCPPVSGPECHKPRYPRDTCIQPSSLTFRVSLSLSSYAAAMAAAMAAAIPLDRSAGPFAVPNAFAANDTALPLVPRASTPLKFSKEVPSRIIKGCWQLSGGHRGDPSSDRTSGPAAVDDFASFVNAGIDTVDTGPEACGYGPSELIIGEALKSGKISRDGESILFYVRTGN